MKKAVICIAKTHPQLETIVSRLLADGFSRDDISVLLPNQSGKLDFAHEANTKAPEGAVAGAGVGGLLGGGLGLLAGIGALAIPGLGPFIAAGPIMAALSGIAAGAAVGGVSGGLVGLGIPEIEAKRYEGKLKEGNYLVSVHTETSDERKRVESVFRSEGADDISTTFEASVPKATESRPAEPTVTESRRF